MPGLRRTGFYGQIIGASWGWGTLLTLAVWLVASLVLIQWDAAFILSAMFAASFFAAALLDRLRAVVRKQRGDRR